MKAQLDSRPGRDSRTHRSVEVVPGFHRLAEGSVLYKCEGTVVVATVSVDETVPRFLEGSGRGWVTAEYQMHPRANPKRREQRDGRAKPPSGRTREIERLIGRALRAAVNMDALGERTLAIDCDILEADGGTRTASITAGWIALALAADKLMTRGILSRPLLEAQVASISVGHVQGQYLLDLNYAEDSTARVDLNLVATGAGDIVEVQGTAEGRAVPRSEIDAMIDLGLEGVASLAALQRATLEQSGVQLFASVAGMSGLGEVPPVDGVRVSLHLSSATATDATYACVVRWNDAASGSAAEALGEAHVTIDPAGVEFTGLEQVPEPTLAFVRTLLRTTARSIQDARWPRRITRWRDDH